MRKKDVFLLSANRFPFHFPGRCAILHSCCQPTHWLQCCVYMLRGICSVGHSEALLALWRLCLPLLNVCSATLNVYSATVNICSASVNIKCIAEKIHFWWYRVCFSAACIEMSCWCAVACAWDFDKKILCDGGCDNGLCEMSVNSFWVRAVGGVWRKYVLADQGIIAPTERRTPYDW